MHFGNSHIVLPLLWFFGVARCGDSRNNGAGVGGRVILVSANTQPLEDSIVDFG
eukprot:m.680347 g.680347  ORF g.680347 m.680347 type:complete len:54 (+) comp22810_c0_seq86:2351-2512(+)